MDQSKLPQGIRLLCRLFFKDYYPVAGSCAQRFMSLLHGKKLCRLLCHMTMPHMYVAWRDALASNILDILLQYAQGAHHLDSDPYFLAGVACIKCRVKSNCNEKRCDNSS